MTGDIYSHEMKKKNPVKMMISIKGNLENTLNKKRIEMIDKLLQ